MPLRLWVLTSHPCPLLRLTSSSTTEGTMTSVTAVCSSRSICSAEMERLGGEGGSEGSQVRHTSVGGSRLQQPAGCSAIYTARSRVTAASTFMHHAPPRSPLLLLLLLRRTWCSATFVSTSR